jgi:hypothetical protein
MASIAIEAHGIAPRPLVLTGPAAAVPAPVAALLAK